MRARLLLLFALAVVATSVRVDGVAASPGQPPAVPGTSSVGAMPLVEHQVEMVQVHLDRGATIAALAARLTQAPPAVTDPATFLVPAAGPVSSTFGPRWGRAHTGTDIDAPAGAPIVAAQAGTVAHAGWKNGYGLTVIIDHGDGLRTLYAHQSQIQVRPQDGVERGQVIGAVGSTGRVTGANLHYEVITNGVPRDPAPWL